MTPQKKSSLLTQLQRAINETVSESSHIAEIVEELNRSGYDLSLKMEFTVAVTPTEDHQRDGVPEPRLLCNVSAPDAPIDLTDEDLEFLQELRIAA
jgi:hypothetical protein